MQNNCHIKAIVNTNISVPNNISNSISFNHFLNGNTTMYTIGIKGIKKNKFFSFMVSLLNCFRELRENYNL